MDEGEKPFPIEFFVILLIIAAANDVAEIIFDLLDFTGVGIAGEAIMVPIDLVLDVFFTGVFIWRVGFGGGTITQYIDDLLEPFLIPGRTISVGLGMWIANNPSSKIAKVANTATSFESGNLSGAISVTEETAGELGDGSKAEDQSGININNGGEDGGAKIAEEESYGGTSGGESPDQQGSPEDESGDEENKASPQDNVFKNPYENPMGTAGEELNTPSGEDFHEGEGFKSQGGAQEENPRSQKVFDISSRRPPGAKKKSGDGNANDPGLSKAA
jgi:hypothetical protein